MSASPLDWLDSLQGSGIRPGLDRIRALLAPLGDPHLRLPSVIIAGTNGKGSTAATLASILAEAGYRTALYTSPHLVDLRERWLIDGRPIEEQLLIDSIRALQEAALRSGISPTYFEALTIIAFIAFDRADCEIAVLEVGMGGRLDATNVVKPLAALITPVSFDHMEYLGNTIEKIAGEKAGIIHEGSVALTTNDDPAVLAVLERRAAEVGVPLIRVTEEHDTPLAGTFQRRNTALAVRAARELQPRLPRISQKAISDGVARTRWRGRLEHVKVDDRQIWIDGGHNAHAADAIAPFIETAVPSPRLLVFGIMSDKDAAPVTGRLFPLFDRILITEPYAPRSAAAAALAAAAGPKATAITEPDAAFRAALAGPERSIVITGSLYLAGAAIAFFDKIAGDDHH